MIDIEMTEEILPKQKKDKSGMYYQQVGYASVLNRQGEKARYPERVNMILSKDDNGEPIVYKPGMYSLSPQSIRVNAYGSLEIGFPTLIPKTQGIKKAS